MDEDDVYIVWIACHGSVYDKTTQEKGKEQIGNIILDQHPSINYEISTFAQEGSVGWDGAQQCLSHTLQQRNLGDVFNYNTSFDIGERKFKSERARAASMPLLAGTSMEIDKWAEAEKFCSVKHKRFPNMWLSDYKSEDEGTEHYMEAPTPTGSPRSEHLGEIQERGLSIYGPSSGISNPIFKTTITDIRKVLIEDKEVASLIEKGFLSDPAYSPHSVNLDHILMYYLPKATNQPTINFKVIINACIGPNLVDTVLQNVSEGLTWPRRLPENVEIETLNYNDIARGCGRQPRSLVPPDTGLNKKALELFRDGERYLGGRKKIKNTKKKGKKKKSKKKRGKKQTKRNRGKKQTKSKKYRKK